MNDRIDKIADEIVDKISKLPKGSEFVFDTYFNDYEVDMQERFNLINTILELCKNKNIDIVNTQSGLILGMPWVYKFKKNN